MNYLIVNGSEPQEITEAQANFIQFLEHEGDVNNYVNGLSLLEEIVIYSSSVPLDVAEKSALFYLKELKNKLKKTLM